MKGLFKKDKKDKTEPSNAHEYSSGFNLMENILNRPYRRHQATLSSTSTAPVQMPAVSGPSSSAPKPDVNDVMVSSLASDFTQMQVDHSGSGPSASTLGHTMATTNSTALEHKPSKRREQSLISSRFTIGQEKAFNEVCDCLTKSEVGMVGIHGMGGVGKTTLMKKVCYEFLKPSNFKVIWIVVSKTVNKDNIQKSLMRELKLSFHEDQDTQARGMDINEALSNNKDNVALLLDDIWEALDLQELGVAGGIKLDMSKFKIIFSTRYEDVCLQMVPDKKMRIECLGPEDSWALFKQSVGDKTLNSHDQILGLAKKVAKECAGLPLALTVIGKAMVCKTSLGAWKDALNSLTKISGAEEKLFERLKFSYDNLENQVEKGCFLFCCMYPEDKEMDKDILVGSWIGEGLLDVGYGTYEEACNRGHGIIDSLVAKSLVMQSKYSSSMIVKMHDVIRDMGLWIGPEWDYFVHTASLKLSGEEIARRWNTARWIYVEGHNDNMPQELDCPNLSSLHIGFAAYGLDVNFMNFKCEVKVLIIEYFWLRYFPIPTFGQLVGLRHLEIRNSTMEALPPEIGNLTKLLALILIGNRKLSTLPPTIGGLCELRKLQISHSHLLKSIPSEVGKLKKLEMVDISAGGMYRMYKGNIFNECTELRSLRLSVQGYIFNDCTDLPYNWKKLEELCIKIRKKYLTPESGPFSTKGLKRLTSLKVLTMDGWPIDDGDELIFAIGAMCRLRELRIISCNIDKLVIPSAIDFLPQLEVLEITECRRLKKVHFEKRALQSLCILKISHCGCLAHVVGLQHLLQLRELKIAFLGCFEEGLVTASDDDGHGLLSDVQTHSASFPNLQRLRLVSLWGMKHVCNDNVSFPSLSEFRLYDCLMLEKLPRGLMNENRSTPMMSGEIVGREEWWEGLEWEDDDAFEAYLRPLFLDEKHLVGVQHLPQLRELTIYDLEDFREGLITTTDDDGHCFPNLQCSRLESLRQMKHMCNDNVSLPSLSEFRLDDCPMLEKLPRGLMNESRSTTTISGEIVGTEEWWEGLEWEDDDFKAYLRPLFVADQHGLVINRRP